MGLNTRTKKNFERVIDKNIKGEVLKLIAEREVARRNKNFKKADEIRVKLKQMNILIDDTSDGTKWKIDG